MIIVAIGLCQREYIRTLAQYQSTEFYIQAYTAIGPDQLGVDSLKRIESFFVSMTRLVGDRIRNTMYVDTLIGPQFVRWIKVDRDKIRILLKTGRKGNPVMYEIEDNSVGWVRPSEYEMEFKE